MSLMDQISGELKTSLKAGDRTRTSILRMLTAALKNERIELRRDLTDEDVLTVIGREVKRRKDAAEQYRAGGAAERADTEDAEAAVLSAWLPAGLTEAELDAAIDEVLAETGAVTGKDMGRVMGILMSRHRGRIDGRLARQKVSARLG